MDLDRFKEYVRVRGLSVYKPNIITGTLSGLVEDLVRRFQAVVVYGLDWDRGTEEVILEIPGVEASELEQDLIRIAREVHELGSSITIIALTGYVSCTPAKDRREAYSNYLRSRAKGLLESFKRRCGGVVYIDGVIVWSRVSLGVPLPLECNHRS